MICHIPFSRRQLLCPTTILCAFVLLLSSLSLYAQNDSTPKRGFQPGGSYALGEIETINTSGGNLMFHLPLVSLPAGRSGNSMGKIGLFYNSKLWDLRPEVMWTGYTGSPNLPIPQTYTRQRLVQSPEGGWRYGLKYELQLFDRMDEFQNAQNTPLQFLPNCGQTIDKATARWKLKMAFPDGSIHEFRPQGFAQGYPPQPGYEGWYKIRPDGWETDCIGGANQNVIGGGKGTTNAMTWYTVDGTFLKLVIQHDTDDGSSVYSTAWKNNFWTLYFPDGSRVSFDSSGSETIYDRNNTFASVWNGIDTSQPGSPNSTFIDDPGHELVLNYNGGGSGIDNVRMKGANNQDLVYQVKWGLGGSINQSYQKIGRAHV